MLLQNLVHLSFTRFQISHGHYAFSQIFTAGGASCNLNPSMEAVDCKIKLARKSCLSVTVSLELKMGVIIDE